MNIIDGKKVRDEIKEELLSKINSLDKKLKLAVIQVGNNEASNVYVNAKKNLALSMNIDFELFHYDVINSDELIKVIHDLNNDSNVTGILVQLPLPSNLDTNKIIEEINPKKDVDGLTSYNLNQRINGNGGIVPCTTLGILKLFDYYHIPLEGKRVCLIGRSRLVGFPTYIELSKRNATITVCHSKTTNLEEITKESDIIISATGKKHLVTSNMVKDGAVIIDVGITREDKLYGDVDFDNVSPKCSYITPVPGGVGPMTTIMLINNILECHNLQ